MRIRLKKLIGTFIFVLGTVIFFLFAISIAIVRLPGTPLGLHLLFYIVTTAIWFALAAILIRWMQKPGSQS